MKNWRNIFSYRTEREFELGSHGDLRWDMAEGAAYLNLSYGEIEEKLGEGNEQDWGEDPEIDWVLKWPDGIATLISASTRNWNLDEGDNPYEALRNSSDHWTIWVGNWDAKKTEEIIERLVNIFGRDVVE